MKTLVKFNNYIAAAAIASLLLLSGLVGIQLIGAQTASAQNIKQNLCDGAEFNVKDSGKTCAELDPNASEGGAENSVNKLVTKIVNIFTIIVGIIAVIMIIIGGFKFITSGGDSNRVASAKNTIIYALVGLVIVALAQVIVRFVLSATPSS